MIRVLRQATIACGLAAVLSVAATASSADDHHHHGTEAPVERPKVFLDKSPRIVEYQLKRLDNARLLLVERETSHEKYAPVYHAILVRPGISRKDRDESLSALCVIRNSNPVSQILDAIDSLNGESGDQQRVARLLAEMLLQLPESTLQQHADRLEAAARARKTEPISRTAGLAGLILLGRSEIAWDIAGTDETATIAWLDAVSFLTSAPARQMMRPRIADFVVSNQPPVVRNAAIHALGFTDDKHAQSCALLAPLVSDPVFRESAVQTLLRLPQESRDEMTSRVILSSLLAVAEQTPVAERTTDAFIDAMLLTDQLLSRIPPAESTRLRAKFRELSVRVIRIRTIHEEMRYDTPYFAVEAGKSVQLVLHNDDLMPHNLVLVQPGTLQEVAQAGADLGPATGHTGLPYVPVSDQVLQATGMVEAGRVERLTFMAPEVPGEYPYVCTFPRHWMRMYGVMLVVPDLDAWQRAPIPPKDPLGNNRTFVQSWKSEDFSGDLAVQLQGRSSELGARLFREATCAQCHKVGNDGGAIGPALNDVLTRWKGDHRSVLREILDPSYRIEPRYVVHVVLTTDGRSHSGIIKAEDEKSISLLINPEAPQPTVIPRDQIDEIIPTPTSMMPKALLDKFTREELLEILHYVCSPEQTAPSALR